MPPDEDADALQAPRDVSGKVSQMGKEKERGM
jgi:hypothetical protein